VSAWKTQCDGIRSSIVIMTEFERARGDDKRPVSQDLIDRGDDQSVHPMDSTTIVSAVDLQADYQYTCMKPPCADLPHS
jgi:hypothetical protein